MFKMFLRKIKNIFRSRSRAHQEDVRRSGDDSTETSTGTLWIPFAENVHRSEGIKMRSRGEYKRNESQGLVVHFHAGWHVAKSWISKLNPFPKIQYVMVGFEAMAREYALRCCESGKKNGYNFLVMDVLGNIYQSRPLNKWGYHAGKSKWKGMYAVSDEFAGIEILNPGKLKKRNGKLYTWFDQEIPVNQARKVRGGDGQQAGWYCAFTVEQEKALVKLVEWMDENLTNFSIDNVVGHDEVAPNRKNDPGGALSLSMPKFRAALKGQGEFRF